jgi:UDP-glucose 4-epimerase
MTDRTREHERPSIVVVGANGFIGRRIVRRLADETTQVRAVIRTMPSEPIRGAICFALSDAPGDSELRDFMRGADAVIYAAGESVPSKFNLHADRLMNEELESLERICRLVAQASVPRIVYLSSGGTVYGEGGGVKHQEDQSLAPKNMYGRAKVLSERFLLSVADERNISPIMLRISNLYGVGQIPARGQGVVATFAAALIANDAIHLWGDGSEIRDYLYIDDAVNAILAATRYRGLHKTFNIGSGQGISVLEVLSRLEKLVGPARARVTHPRSPEAVAHNVLDCQLAREELDWRASTSIDVGLAHTVEWLKEEWLKRARA